MLAGNVFLNGIVGLAQCLLTRNAALLKVSSRDTGLTELFVSVREKVRCPGGIRVGLSGWDRVRQSAEEALNVIAIGDKCRSVAHTQMNEASSRSHSLFILNITQRHQDGSSTVSRLNLADLAGSEQVRRVH